MERVAISNRPRLRGGSDISESGAPDGDSPTDDVGLVRANAPEPILTFDWPIGNVTVHGSRPLSNGEWSPRVPLPVGDEMASVSTGANGNRRLVFTGLDRRRRTVYLGNMSARGTDDLKRLIESILEASA